LKKKIILFVLIIAIAFSHVSATMIALKKGDIGDDVKKVQTRLKQWGYYNGAVDGIYGSSTQAAVKLFQKRNGLTADGICGSKTAKAIGITLSVSGGGGSSLPSSSDNVYLLARAIYAEARGEPYTGQVAVAAVILNRVASSQFPNTISGVIYQKNAFSSVNDGQINLTPSDTAIKAAKDALNGWDPCNGALYFYNPKTSTSQWIFTRTVIAKIGRHNFAV